MIDATRTVTALGPRSLALRALAAALTLALAACGTVPEPPAGPPEGPPEGEPPSLTVTLASAAVNLLRGAAADVEVTVTRAGQPSGDVTLSVAGALPPGVSATFAPDTLGSGETESVLTVATTAEASAGTFDVQVVAASADAGNGAAEATAQLVVDVDGLTVEGRVVDLYGVPLRDVLVGSQGETDVTRADGTFTLADLAVPYDLMAARRDVEVLQEYQGLSTPTPELVIFQDFEAPDLASSARISGDVAGGGALAADEEVYACVEGTAIVVFGCSYVRSGETAYEIEATWLSPAPQKVRVHAFLAHVVGDTVIDFRGYDTFEVDVADGDDLSKALGFDAVETRSLTGRISPWSGPTPPAVVEAVAAVRFSDKLSITISAAGSTGPLAMPVPALPGEDWEYDLAVAGYEYTPFTSSRVWLTAAGLDAGEVVLPDAPGLVRPEHGAFDVTLETEFEVAGLTGQAKTFYWAPTTFGGPVFAVTTTEDVVTLPDPSELGLGLPKPWGAYRWGVVSTQDGSVDDALAGMLELWSAVASLMNFVGGAPTADGQVVEAGDWEFTFDPCCAVGADMVP